MMTNMKFSTLDFDYEYTDDFTIEHTSTFERLGITGFPKPGMPTFTVVSHVDASQTTEWTYESVTTTFGTVTKYVFGNPERNGKITIWV